MWTLFALSTLSSLAAHPPQFSILNSQFSILNPPRHPIPAEGFRAGLEGKDVLGGVVGGLLGGECVAPRNPTAAVGTLACATILGVERVLLTPAVVPVVPPLGPDGGGEFTPDTSGIAERE